MYKILGTIYFPTTILCLLSCSPSEKHQQIKSPLTDAVTIAVEDSNNEPLHFTYEDISKYAIASVTLQDPSIIKVNKEDNLYFVTYRRKTDRQQFNYKIRFAGNKVIWASVNGRWRDSADDAMIYFKEEGKTLQIIQKFSDGSESKDEYSYN